MNESNLMAKLVRLCASIFILIILIGCLEEKYIVQTPVDQQDIVNLDLNLINAVIDVTSQDGSDDNILDNSSCLTVIYPYSVRVKGKRIDLESSDDISELLKVYEQEVTNPNQFQIIYPVLVSKADYSIVEVKSKAEMREIQGQCVEGGDDPDIECVDFVYPINVSSLDTLNQKANVLLIEEDETLFHLMNKAKNQTSSEIFSIEYPVSLTGFNNNDLTITSNEALVNVIEGYRNTCDEMDTTFLRELRKGHLSVRLIDAPFPVDLVNQIKISIERFEATYRNEIDGTQTITLFESDEPATMDLLSLINSNSFELAGKDVPIGDYTTLILHLSEVKVHMNDGQAFDVNVPGGVSGIRINVNPQIQIDYTEAVNLFFDFNVSQSFIPKGNNNNPAGITGFTLKPTFNIIDNSNAGSLFGLIEDQADEPLKGAQVSLIEKQNSKTFSSTFSDSDGHYSFPAVPPGIYDLTVEKDSYNTYQLPGLTIAVSASSEINAVLKTE